jgi:hypothetical protein
MKRIVTLTLMVAVSMFLVGSALAGTASQDINDILRSARAAIVVPPEWDGVWSNLDSSYTCADVFQSTNTVTDTICGGKEYSPSGQSSSLNFSCTGTADATTLDLTCTASQIVFPNCTADYTIVFHGTLTGSTYHIVSTANSSYSGTGTGCGALPPICTQGDSWGTRLSPAPPGYCSTPTRSSTWGELKTRYK